MRGEAKPPRPDRVAGVSTVQRRVCVISDGILWSPRRPAHYSGGRNNRLVCGDSAAFPDVGRHSGYLTLLYC